MDIVVVFNGLGNQMSQYALYLSKKARGQHVSCICRDTAHNGIELDTVFGIPTRMNFIDRLLQGLYLNRWPRINRVLRKLNMLDKIIETDHSFQSHVLTETRGIRFLIGGWHHPSYFSAIESTIREVYKFPAIMDDSNLKVLRGAHEGNAVAIHIRRGDYMHGADYQLYGSVCTECYYMNAIRYMKHKIGGTLKFYVFSDDMQWSREFLDGKDCVYVEWNQGVDSWKDMYLMSQFKHLIISNSTFSWWAANLGQKEKIVCRPPFFVNHEHCPGFYPESWVEIDNK